MAQATRRRITRRSVLIVEVVARTLITLGGLTTIVAVALLCGFLLWVAVPLFGEAQVGPAQRLSPASSWPLEHLAHLVVDEQAQLGAAFLTSGEVQVRRLADGALVSRHDLFGQAPSAWAFHAGAGSAVFGFGDGSLALVSFGFAVSFLDEQALEDAPGLAALGPDDTATHLGGLVTLSAEGRHRLEQFRLEVGEPLDGGGSRAILRIDHVDGGRRERIATLDDVGRLRLLEATRRRNLLTDAVSVSLSRHDLPYTPRPSGGPPRDLFLTGQGGGLLLLWEDGGLRRLELSDLRRPRVAEERALLASDERRVSAARLMLGRQTLLVGDDSGRLAGWFLTRPPDAGTLDGGVFQAAHELLPAGGPAVAELVGSGRSRLLAAGLADGQVVLLHGTTEARLGTLDGAPGARLAWLPREDGLLALAPDGLRRWSVQAGHPEASLATLFTPVWYEGYSEPRHEWQSSSASDASEPKFGLYPLVFGTLKATVYSMLFGAPLALMAAIFTSEFLRRRVRSPVKTTVELMASLPSVVLGYLAGIVVAPFAAQVVPALLSGLVIVPAVLVLAAHVWQLLPASVGHALAGTPRLLAIALAMLAGVGLSWVCGPLVEQLCFAGDLVLWLDGQRGSALGGWALLLTPLAALAVALGATRWWGPLWRARLRGSSRRVGALVGLAQCLLGLLLSVLLALGAAGLLTLLGLDPRDSVLGTFEVRNSLVVGFVMGFAIIPIIYTLAEDALSSVPEHLRLASLGTGATSWQTAVRVVVPTAMSGLFSALMIGLGRAVGETMIVLMATGNTAVTDWNVFNGFRTLSANIAVELPEAPPGTTHYRTLFLAALVLFAMTFVLNTLAELVRQRFRKRAHQL